MHRVQALTDDLFHVSVGDIGGWVESENNLSHDGDCWVYDDAKVYAFAVVSGDAEIRDDAEVYGGAIIRGNARVCGYANLSGDTADGDITVNERSII